MNRYPLWKYIVMIVALGLGILYTVPNFFGNTPAIQFSSSKATTKVTANMREKVEQTLNAAGVVNQGVYFTQNGNAGSFRVRFADDKQAVLAQQALEAAFNPNPDDRRYATALSTMSTAPDWMIKLGARPMALGLDLQGGVHFTLKVELDGAIAKRLEGMSSEVILLMRDEKITVKNIARADKQNYLVASFDNPEVAAKAAVLIEQKNASATAAVVGSDVQIGVTEQAAIEVRNNAMNQNISTIHKRVAELGVSEPLIQKQGLDNIVVELPGITDPVRVKNLIGKTASLQIRMVDETGGFGSETFIHAGRPVLIKKQLVASGDNVVNARPDTGDQGVVVSVTLDSVGGKIMRQTTRDNLGKPMAMILYEEVNGKAVGEVVSLSNIAGEFGENFQIMGQESFESANDLAVLLRAGSLAAPMKITEESSVGPSLGVENIKKGLDSLKYGFLAVSLFIGIYYGVFGLISVISLGVNLLLLVGILSFIGETMTLPGIAAVALTLGMAIDSNVLINERIREELRAGYAPQQAIYYGYERAFATILDSNVTTLIAGLALLIFGTGPIHGFAVVHCLGIVTSMFSAVFFSRGLTSLIYGGRARLNKISIGTVWKSDTNKTKL